MKSQYPKLRAAVTRSLVAAAAAAACSAASALPAFTLAPSAVGLAGTAFTADNLLVSDFATVTYTPNGFKESGFLAITGAQFGGSQIDTAGLGSTYGLYIAFDATATTVVNTGAFQAGNFDTLTYTLYGYNGPGTFSPTSAPAPSIKLGSGELVTGTFSGSASGTTVTSASATTTLTFAQEAAASAFFASPSPFYAISQAAFTNTSQQISSNASGFVVTQGGGSVNFVAAPVPEPETYALMLGGLGALGFLARRRKID